MKQMLACFFLVLLWGCHPRLKPVNVHIFMLRRARVLQSLLEDAGMERQLHVGHGGHNYSYWVSHFEMYLQWMIKDW